jgi:DNA gyrase subunit A
LVGDKLVAKGTTLLTVTENGCGKRTKEAEYRTRGRGGTGVIDIETTDRKGRVIGAVQAKDDDEVMIITNAGVLIRMKVKEISVIGRNTQGVRLITLDSEQEKVSGLSRLPEGGSTPTPAPQAPPDSGTPSA